MIRVYAENVQVRISDFGCRISDFMESNEPRINAEKVILRLESGLVRPRGAQVPFLNGTLKKDADFLNPRQSA